MKNNLEMFFIILCFIVFNICGFFYMKFRFDEIKQKEKSTENLGTFLITKYNIAECKNKKTKTGETPEVGTCGISPDLKDILWMHDWIYVEGYGELRVNTLTHPKHKRVIDIFTKDLQEAKTHGAVRKRVWLIKENT